MRILPQAVSDLIDAFASLPGIGPKSASRLAFSLLKRDNADLIRFGNYIKNLKNDLAFCEICQNITISTPCDICKSSDRQKNIICVVEDTLDVVAIENSGHYQGLYHVLQGVLSPIDGMGPDKIRLNELERRLKGHISEIILATNPTVEGEATALYILRMLKKYPQIKITRLAHGLPIGADLEYADQITLAQALEGRQTLKENK